MNESSTEAGTSQGTQSDAVNKGDVYYIDPRGGSAPRLSSFRDLFEQKLDSVKEKIEQYQIDLHRTEASVTIDQRMELFDESVVDVKRGIASSVVDVYDLMLGMLEPSNKGCTPQRAIYTSAVRGFSQSMEEDLNVASTPFEFATNISDIVVLLKELLNWLTAQEAGSYIDFEANTTLNIALNSAVVMEVPVPSTAGDDTVASPPHLPEFVDPLG